jgi:hydrogenase maturation protease
MPRTLIAGIGNIFFGDDGFGVEVARRLAAEPLPSEVKLADYGIRGMHLAYDLLDGAYESAILVDATPRGGAPGTVYLIEPDLDAGAGAQAADAHAMTPDAVFAMLRSLGGTKARIRIVGCEPASVEEGIGLSPPVSEAVGEAVRLIRDQIMQPQEP